MPDKTPESLNYNCEMVQEHNLYVVVSEGDGYYYGEPEAVFFRETPAHIYKDTVKGRKVFEIPLYQTEEDGWDVESTSMLQNYKAMSAVLSRVENASGDAIATIIEQNNITPEDFLSEDIIETIANELHTSPGENPDSWSDEIENIRNE